MSVQVSAKLVVGLPVYNERRYIEGALEALARQDHADFRVLISDNASADGSGELCESFAARDRRFVYVRQRENIGAARNFNYCLEASSSEHFMWCGAHDLLSDNFLSTLSAALDRDSRTSLAFGTRLAIDENSVPIASMSGDDRYVYRFSRNRFLRYAQAACALSECTIVYGVFRRKHLDGFVVEPVKSLDRVLLSHALFFGKLEYAQSATYFRRFFGARSSDHAERILGAVPSPRLDDQGLVRYFAADLDMCFGTIPGSQRHSWRKSCILQAIRTRYLHRSGKRIGFLARLQVQPGRTARGWLRHRLRLPV